MIRAYDDNGNVVDLVEWEKEIRTDVIEEILLLPKHNHYDNYNELMYQSIKVEDIEKLKEQK